jgi:5-methylcytosine-specific restriction protein B
VEGIKPELDHSSDDAELKTSSQLGYTVKAGIFKQMCAQAAYECFRYGDSRKQNKAEITFDQLYEAFLDEMQLKMRLKEPIEFQTISGNTVVLKRINKNGSIITQAKDSSPTRRNEPAPKTKENFRKLWETYSSMEQLPNLQQIKEVLQISPGISGFYAVFAALKEFKNVLARRYNAIEGIFEDEGLSDDAIVKQFEEGRFDEYVSAHAAHAKPFILIIDEINRGNIAAIFGELITLIENDKRLGRDEGLKLRLPYSNTLFYVPANLYIIGTMNTADRSVEALDTALRRRFTFSEKGPEPETLSATIEGIDLRALLSTINSRLEILIDRDHTLGHAWFIKVKKLDELRTVFAQKIIPLLKEFFFNDYGKIGLILGNAFIEPVNRLDKGIFADFEDADDYDTFLDRKQYHFNDVNRITAESFKKIYAINTGMAVLPAFTESGSINVN